MCCKTNRPRLSLIGAVLAHVLDPVLGPIDRRSKSAINRTIRESRRRAEGRNRDNLTPEQREARRAVRRAARAAEQDRQTKAAIARLAKVAPQVAEILDPYINPREARPGAIGSTWTIVAEDESTTEAVKPAPGGWLYRVRARVARGVVSDHTIVVEGTVAPHGWPLPRPAADPTNPRDIYNVAAGTKARERDEREAREVIAPRNTGAVAADYLDRLERLGSLAEPAPDLAP